MVEQTLLIYLFPKMGKIHLLKAHLQFAFQIDEILFPVTQILINLMGFHVLPGFTCFFFFVMQTCKIIKVVTNEESLYKNR